MADKSDRGATWTCEEVKYFIDVWGEDNVQLELEGAVRNKHIYERIAAKMVSKGFQRSGRQCQTKLKALKKDYKDTKDNNNRSGRKAKHCKFYEELDEILGSRPSTAPRVMLSSAEATPLDEQHETVLTVDAVDEEDSENPRPDSEQTQGVNVSLNDDDEVGQDDGAATEDSVQSRPVTPLADTTQPRPVTTALDATPQRPVTPVMDHTPQATRGTSDTPQVTRRPKVKSRLSGQGSTLQQTMDTFVQMQRETNKRHEEAEAKRFNKEMEMEEKRMKWDMEMAEKRMRWQEEMEEKRQRQKEEFELRMLREKEEAEIRRERYKEEMELRREKQRQDFELRCLELNRKPRTPEHAEGTNNQPPEFASYFNL